MVDAATVLRLAAGLVLLLGNGYFVTIEFAMTRVRQFGEEAFRGSGGLERAWEMTERLEIYLSGCQLGITVCSVGLGVVAEPALAAVVAPALSAVGLAGTTAGGGHTALAAVASLAVINLLHLTVGEQAPTYLGIERTRTIARYGAPILYWWTTLLSPVITLADRLAKAILGLLGVTITRSWAEQEVEEEFGSATRAQLVREMGNRLASTDLPEDRRREVINALAIDRIRTSDVMVDREDVVAVSTERSPAENFAAMEGTPHSRFPLVGESLDDVAGVVYVPALLDNRDALESGEVSFADVAAPPMTVAPALAVSDLIDAFQHENQELAMVVEDGRTVGLVTATDAFETIAGELEDPLDLEAGAQAGD